MLIIGSPIRKMFRQIDRQTARQPDRKSHTHRERRRRRRRERERECQTDKQVDIHFNSSSVRRREKESQTDKQTKSYTGRLSVNTYIKRERERERGCVRRTNRRTVRQAETLSIHTHTHTHTHTHIYIYNIYRESEIERFRQTDGHSDRQADNLSIQRKCVSESLTDRHTKQISYAFNILKMN